MVLLQRKLYFPKDPEVVQHFPGWEGGVQLFPGGGGVQMQISIETHMGGGGGGGIRTWLCPYQIHIITRYLIKGLYSSTTNSKRET